MHTCGKFPRTMASDEELDIELFIDAIKGYPEIWNISSEMYHDRIKKRSAWIKVCEMFSKEFSEKGDREKNEICNKFIKKWRNIKDSFLKCLKKKTKSGQAANSGRTYIYARQLSFLQQTVTTSETQSSLPEEPDTDQVRESRELPEGEGDLSSIHRSSDEERGRKNKPTKRSIEQSLIQYMNTPIQIPASTVKTNPDRAFFESILPSIESFTEDQKLDFRCEVLSIVKRMRLAMQTTPSMSQTFQHQPSHTSVSQAASYQPLYPAPPILTELQVTSPSATYSHTVQPQAATHQTLYPARPMLTELQARPPSTTHSAHIVQPQAAAHQTLYPASPILTELQVHPPSTELQARQLSATYSARTAQPSSTLTSPSGSQTDADDDLDIFST